MVDKVVDTSSLLRMQYLDRVLQPNATEQTRAVAERKKDREEQEEQRRDRFEQGYYGQQQQALWDDLEPSEREEPEPQAEQPPPVQLISAGRQLELPGLQVVSLTPARQQAAPSPGQRLDIEA